MNRKSTAIVVGTAAAALLSLGAVTYAASGGNGPWRHLMGDGMGGMHGQETNGMRGGMDGSGMDGSGMHAGRMHADGMSGMSGMSGDGWTVPAATGGSADATERADLLRMVEEEKLAHDVYVALRDRWGVPMFDHIASAETQHEAALRTLLDRYGITDPTAGHGVGEFTDPAFDRLYTRLVAEGSVTEDAAYATGQLVEQMDIDDLRTRIDRTDDADVTAVYEHLLAGSEHHLRAFTMMRGASS